MVGHIDWIERLEWSWFEYDMFWKHILCPSNIILNETNSDCLPIFKWLMSQCENNGKFDTNSEQDVIIGIEALSELARKFNINELNVVNIPNDATNNTKYNWML